MVQIWFIIIEMSKFFKNLDQLYLEL